MVEQLREDLNKTSKSTNLNTKIVKEYFEKKGNRLPADMQKQVKLLILEENKAIDSKLKFMQEQITLNTQFKKKSSVMKKTDNVSIKQSDNLPSGRQEPFDQSNRNYETHSNGVQSMNYTLSRIGKHD